MFPANLLTGAKQPKVDITTDKTTQKHARKQLTYANEPMLSMDIRSHNFCTNS